MTYFVFDIVWSQTDKDTVIVQADNEKKAKESIEKQAKGYRWISCVRQTNRLDVVK